MYFQNDDKFCRPSFKVNLYTKPVKLVKIQYTPKRLRDLKYVKFTR